MKRDRKQRRILLLLVLLLGVTIGFALLSTTLKINGTAGIKSSTWDIHWENVQPNSQSTVTAQTPVISEHATKVSYEVTLELPGDFYEFTVDAKNDGSVNGEITDVRHSVKEVTIENNEEVETTATLPSYIHSTVYYNGTTTPPAIGDILAAGEKQTYVVRIEYDEDSEELPPTDKTYRVTTEIDYGQTKKDPPIPLDDIVYFDPVNYEFCDADKSSESCYEWVTISRKNNKIYELFMLDSLDSLSWTEHNPASIISTATSTWSNKLQNVDTSYDFEPVAGYNVNFSTTKARMLLKSEYDNLSSDIQNIIKKYTGLTATPCGAGLNSTDQYVAVITPGGMYNSYSYQDIPNSTLSSYTIRPVIKLDITDEDMGNRPYPTKNKKYNAGDLVYFDPVSNSPCNANTFTYNDVVRILTKYDSSVEGNRRYKTFGTSTCYKWRVIETNDTTSDKTINIQLDHNLIDNAAWQTSRNYTQPPRILLNTLATATSNWSRVPLLDYDYSYGNAKFNYGELLCRKGKCMIPSYSTVCDNSTCSQTTMANVITINSRARIITAEELALLGNFDELNSTWDGHPNNFQFQANMNWLQENVYKYPLEISPNINPYHYPDEVTGDDYDSAKYEGYDYDGSYGYWTLTVDPYYGGIWHTIADATAPRIEWMANSGESYTNKVGIRPVI